MDDTLIELRKKEEEDLAKMLAKKRGMPYLDLSKIAIDIDSLKILSEADARAYAMAVIQSIGKKLQIALTNPDRPGVADILDQLKRKNYEPQLFLVSPTSLEKAYSKYKEIPLFEEIKAGMIDITKASEEFTGSNLNPFALFKNKLEEAKGKEAKKASDVLETMMGGAIFTEASDVHIEPEENSAIVRIRIDGVLQDVATLTEALYRLLVSRIKLVSQVKLNVHDRPQDGRFTVRTKDADIEIRTSVLPGPSGESIVMRLLLPKSISIKLETLGIQPHLYKLLEAELRRPNGMILTTGPTGSGKTTTLYAFLKEIVSTEVKIITIEDPVEYHLPRITQTQVDHSKGYDFSNGLRSIVRQDPDIILVGEIRDLETAEIAMHAALTGHLVFSTLHTNDAVGTIPRLTDLGVKINIISPALNVVMAQRLVRRLCENCKMPVEPTGEEKDLILKNLKSAPKDFEIEIPKEIKIFKEKDGGCEKCNQTGFKGRIGIYEAFFIDDEIERLIVTNPPVADIQNAAIKQGMLTMYQDGISKVIGGITSLDELNRVVSE